MAYKTGPGSAARRHACDTFSHAARPDLLESDDRLELAMWYLRRGPVNIMSVCLASAGLQSVWCGYTGIALAGAMLCLLAVYGAACVTRPEVRWVIVRRNGPVFALLAVSLASMLAVGGGVVEQPSHQRLLLWSGDGLAVASSLWVFLTGGGAVAISLFSVIIGRASPKDVADVVAREATDYWLRWKLNLLVIAFTVLLLYAPPIVALYHIAHTSSGP